TASGRFSSRRCCCIRSSSCADIGIRRLRGILISSVSFMVSSLVPFNRWCIVRGLVATTNGSLQQIVAQSLACVRQTQRCAIGDVSRHSQPDPRKHGEFFQLTRSNKERAILNRPPYGLAVRKELL